MPPLRFTVERLALEATIALQLDPQCAPSPRWHVRRRCNDPASLKRQNGLKILPRVIEDVESIKGVCNVGKIRKTALAASPHDFRRDSATFDRGPTLNARHVVFWVFERT